ncbi:MAG: hypothetical protein R3Y35_12110 [Clostridia bacterium]
MADINVDTDKLNQYAQRISSVTSRVNALDQRLNALYLRVGLLGLWNITKVDAVTNYNWVLVRCQSYLSQTASEFEVAEKLISTKTLSSFNKNSTSDYFSSNLVTAWNTITSFTSNVKNDDNTSTGQSFTASAEWLGYELSDDSLGITAWLGKASATYENEMGYVGVNAYVGKVELEADADLAFMKTTTKKVLVDGVWVEKTVTEFINAEVGASASIALLEADVDGSVGDDMLGLDSKINVSVGNAEASGKGEFSITDEGVNANVSGKALVSAVEGSASGTINFLGFEITAKVGGYAGAVGVEGKAGIEDNKFVLEGGVAAFLGLSAGIEIGFNEQGWDNFTDGVEQGWDSLTGGVEQGWDNFTDSASDFVDYFNFWN